MAGGDEDAKRLANQLYDRLRELLGQENDEDLAHELGTTTRDIARLKEGFGPTHLKLIGMLRVAGWLNPDPKLTPEEARKRAKLYQQTRRIQRQQRRPGPKPR
jgi:hypothetical protein